jgi:hypothetical protein
MHNRLDLDMIVAREKQRDLRRQVEQHRLARPARAGRRARAEVGRRIWHRPVRWLCQVRSDERTRRSSRLGAASRHLLHAFAWERGKE